jgi:4-cresol dehydrogenase (hydroxylating)
MNSSQNDTRLSEALNAWKKALGNEFVLNDETTIAAYKNATYKNGNSILAVIKPKNSAEVSECIKIANQFKTPVYPVSGGKNWGYGSRTPAKDGCVILSLERMNKISEFNEEMAYITVEPGVTFGQVYEFLREKNSTNLPPSIGSTKYASLIGNAMERGIGKGIYGDRFQFSCNMEVVLADGSIINTGFGNIKNSHSQNVYRWGVGPSIDGIFTQSNLGVVTRMTFWLNKKPAYFQAIFYTIKNDEQLEKTVEALRQLRLEGTLNTNSTLSNSHRVLSMKKQFPWDNARGDNSQLSKEYVDAFQKESLQGAVWVGDDAILAPTKAIGKARAKRIKQVLGKAVDQIIFIDNTRAKLLGLLAKPIKLLTGVDMRETLFFFYNSIYLGIPMEKQLSICYWRKKTPVSNVIDPDKDKCGVIWCSPSVPFQGEHITKVLKILETIYSKHSFEPNIGINFMSDRGVAFTAAIIYDREVKGQDEKAMACYNEISETLMKQGYPPYRLGIQSMDKMISTSPEYVNFINRLKSAIDPNNIISPSHYGIDGVDK